MPTLCSIGKAALGAALLAALAVPPASPQEPPEPAGTPPTRAESPSAPPEVLPASIEQPSAPTDAPPAPAPAALCPYCRAPLPAADFCAHCGRFSPGGPDASGRRFWADAPYVLTFPPLENPPEVRSETDGGRWVGESVRYASGDRYDLRQKKDDAEITGRVGGMQGGKESDFTAEMQDTFDAAGRLASRQVTGRVKNDSDLYLYRKLDYRYRGDGRLERIEFVTSFYRGSSDWRKSPAAWLRHSVGEIVLRRDGQGAPARIETTVREGRRSLRGEPEYAEPRLRVEVVTRDGDRITGIALAQP
jgi:hypothetical protein